MTNYENLTVTTRGQKVVIDDSMFQQILLRPDEYNVLATSKLNGDYLSDSYDSQIFDLDKVNPSSVISQYMKWNKSTALIVKAIEGEINNKTFKYNLERQMEGAKFLKCSEFGTAIIENI